MCSKMTFVDPVCSISANCELDQEQELQGSAQWKLQAAAYTSVISSATAVSALR
jgi:hypothetical protein